MSGPRLLPFPSTAFAAIAVLLAVSLPGSASAQAQEDAPSYLTTPGEAERAIGVMIEEIGRTPKVSRIVIEPERIMLLVQGESRAYDVDAWLLTRFRKWFIDREFVSGPEPSQTDNIVANAEGGFFDLSGIALDDVSDVIARAMERASLDDPPEVSRVTIDRRVAIVPERAYGEVRWTIPVASGRESAIVYANAAGAIIGADLSQTNRARRLDLVAQDDWPTKQAKEELLAVIGPGETVYEVRIYNSYIFVVADHPTDPNRTRDYSWNLAGVKRGLVDSPKIGLQMRDIAPFSLDEIDFAKLPQIKAVAREALGMVEEKIAFIEAEKSTRVAGEPRIRWEVEIQATGSERGVAMVGTSGELLEAVLPPSRRPVEPWLAPATIRKTLARIEKEFGTDARFHEIMIDHRKASVLAEDSREPGRMASFIVDAQKVTRFGTPMPWDAQADDARVFTFAELAPLTEERLADLAVRTLEHMRLDGAEVFRYTISRGTMVSPSPDGGLTVEVRAGINDGWTSGWVVYKTDGTEVDVMIP